MTYYHKELHDSIVNPVKILTEIVFNNEEAFANKFMRGQYEDLHSIFFGDEDVKFTYYEFDCGWITATIPNDEFQEWLRELK